MIKSILLLLLLPFICYSQEDDFCRQITPKTLNSVYKDVDGFNAYTKGDVLRIYTESKIKASFQEYKRFSDADRMLKESSKDQIYEILRVMIKMGAFDHSDVEGCTFDSVYFVMTCITSDYLRIHYEFMILNNDMVGIKDSFNKEDVFYKLRYLGVR